MYDGIGSWIESVNWMPRNLPDGTSKIVVAYEHIRRRQLPGPVGDAKTKL